MSATVTVNKGPAVLPGIGYMTYFNIALDNAFASGGEPIDLTSYFELIYDADVTSVDATDDNQWDFGVKIPTQGTAVAADNVVITAYYIPALDGNSAYAQALAEAAGEDLSGVTQLGLRVVGRLKV